MEDPDLGLHPANQERPNSRRKRASLVRQGIVWSIILIKNAQGYKEPDLHTYEIKYEGQSLLEAVG